MNVLSQMNDQIGDLDAEIQKKEEKEKALRSKNREIEVRILTKKQVMALPEPEKTLGGKFKVEPQEYRDLKATALRVGTVDAREQKLDQREQRLQQMKEEIEGKKKLPVKEQLELFQLRKLKEIVVKLVDRLPEGFIKRVLIESLRGRDLLEKAEKQIGRPEQSRHHDREVL